MNLILVSILLQLHSHFPKPTDEYSDIPVHTKKMRAGLSGKHYDMPKDFEKRIALNLNQSGKIIILIFKH